MRITVFTHREELRRLEQLMAAISNTSKTPFECNYYDAYDDFIKGFPTDECRAVIVARNGADGMECARNAKLMQPSVPLIWLSDDEGFGPESYRIGCTFFSACPITENLLKSAFEKCEIEGSF